MLDRNPTIRWVFSDTQISPRVVTTLKASSHTVMFVMRCVLGGNAHICAHCVAAAEDNNDLKEFLNWFATSKGKKCNLTTEAVYHNTYKHAGLK